MSCKILSAFLLVITCGVATSCNSATTSSQPPAPAPAEFKLWNETATSDDGQVRIMVAPGTQTEAENYYQEIRPKLVHFPQPTLAQSSIEDMLAYFGFPAIPPAQLEAREPGDIMDFQRLRAAIATAEFDQAYQNQPLLAGEILAARFFAPKVINVRDPQTQGVPKGGFGWRKVLRFRARAGSAARGDGLDAFFLLFNFTSGAAVTFPEGIHAAQIQAMVTPGYPTNGKHRDGYFFVYKSLGSETPGRMGFFLTATFDIAGTVTQDDNYFVPRACGQCHGTEVANQTGAKVNYLDTDHWIDRTSDDFTAIPAANVLVDGEPSYATFRLLNSEIEKQNDAVLKQSGGRPFALLAVRKWLTLHAEGQATANEHVPVLRRGFIENVSDAVWTEQTSPDQELLPLLNRYCFRCHSSVRYHVFQKQFVKDNKARLAGRVRSGNMPQDRKLDQTVKEQIISLLNQLD